MAAAGLALIKLLQQGARVLGQLLGSERRLADGDVYDAGLLDAKLDLAALSSLTALPTSKVTVPTLGFGMSPRGPRSLPMRPTRPIMSGVAIALSKSSQFFRADLLHQVLTADVVGARLARLAFLFALGEDQHANRLASAVRQHDGAAHVLIGLARIDPEPHGHLDRLVELRLRGLDRQANRLVERVPLRAIY